MHAPKCKLCQKEHWSPVCEEFNTGKAERRVHEIEVKAKPEIVKARAQAKRDKRGPYKRKGAK